MTLVLRRVAEVLRLDDALDRSNLGIDASRADALAEVAEVLRLSSVCESAGEDVGSAELVAVSEAPPQFEGEAVVPRTAVGLRATDAAKTMEHSRAAGHGSKSGVLATEDCVHPEATGVECYAGCRTTRTVRRAVSKVHDARVVGRGSNRAVRNRATMVGIELGLRELVQAEQVDGVYVEHPVLAELELGAD